MPPNKKSLEIVKGIPNIFIALGALLIVFMLIIPMPPTMLDIFMALNLMLSLVILLIVLFIEEPTKFTVFPSLLLLTTVFGLALNVSSTRLILREGKNFQGNMINAFSSFVVGTDGSKGLVIGFIVFIILVAVQAFVITKGATRISEVAARFALDFNPTRSMSIDSEYTSGAITEEEAKEKKADLQRSTYFYGAMDGAAKFVSGNVKIGIFITVINIVAGLIVGIVFERSSFPDALANYTRLTIGDGLLAQLPSLLISVAAGMIVTRSVSNGTFADDLRKEFSIDARVYYITAATLLFLAFLPGFPHTVLAVMAGLFALLGRKLQTNEISGAKAEQLKNEEKLLKEKAAKQSALEETTEPIIPLDQLSLEIGYMLIPLVEESKGADLLKRIRVLRKEVALELGLVAPNIRIMDNIGLEPDEYCFKIQGVEVARSVVQVGSYLALNPGNVQDEIPGRRTTDPAFGLPAVWISESDREKAEMAGYTVVDASALIATHISVVIKRNAADILTRQMVQEILDSVKKKNSVVVAEALENNYLGNIQKIMQGLLREQVSIRNTAAILETISDYKGITNSISIITEKVRQTLGRQIVLQYAGEDRVLRVMTVELPLLQKMMESRVETLSGPLVGWSVEEQRSWISAVDRAFAVCRDHGYGMPIVLVNEEARILVKKSTEKEMPNLVVLSIPEIPSDIKVESLGEIRVS